MQFDRFYKGLKEINKKREKDSQMEHSDINWDEPYAIDFKTAHQVFNKLFKGEEAMCPNYDFTYSQRYPYSNCY